MIGAAHANVNDISRIDAWNEFEELEFEKLSFWTILSDKIF